MNSLAFEINPEYVQGTAEWLALRKTKITATDASIIMGVSPWKTKLQLYHEKTGDDVKPLYMNDAMQRGNDLEPIARDLFNLRTGWNMEPEVIVRDWAMASLDGRDRDSGAILEIKCPGEKDHALAVAGKVPDHYYPQLQHQMWIAGTCMAYYYSFDGMDGVIVKVNRDNEYIEKMVAEEFKFYECMQSKIAPEPSENDYIERNDSLWQECASKWKTLTERIKTLEKDEEELRKQLIFLSGESNTKGGGISLCKVNRKGNVDYSKIPELKNIDLEKYRKPGINSWRINS